MIEKKTVIPDYNLLAKQMNALLEGESDKVANLANGSALLFQAMDNVSWVGFYLVKEGELVLGPFQGKPACVRIPIGTGVCGEAAKSKRTVVVDNVHEFEGHIACDINSKSEIVIPLIIEKELVGVLDIDSPILNRFSEKDKKGLEAVAQVLQTALSFK